MLRLVIIDKSELQKGEREEAEEHGFSKDVAHKTAMDHLTKKDPHYYTKLAQYDLEEDELEEAIKTGPEYPYSDKKVKGKGRYGRIKNMKNVLAVGGGTLKPQV